MRGELGVFYVDGKKIGGCIGWEMHVGISDGINNTKRITSWSATTQRYWFIKKSRQMLACFFWIRDGQAILAYKGLLTLDADDADIDGTGNGKMINKTLGFIRNDDGK